jgi:hypothetical protein
MKTTKSRSGSSTKPELKGGKTVPAASVPIEQVLEAWRANNEVNLVLLDAISDAGFTAVPLASHGRDVARQIMHVHNVRVQWMQSSGPEARELTVYRKEGWCLK